MRHVLAILFVCLLVAPVLAAERSVTLYLDGARVESEVSAEKGCLEFPLPAGLRAGSLRVSPFGRTGIDRVEMVAAPQSPKLAKEMAKLTERKERLEDRLKALASREEIFTAAAKSQSGKAPRKSKSNPEPLLTLRQGTDYAITQLEMVYNARRKADRELKLVERRLDVLKKAGNVGGSVARVWLTGKGGRAKVSYLVNDLRWTPFYDFRLNAEGAAELSLRAILPPLPKGTVAEAVPGLLGTTTNTAAPVKAGHERFPLIAAFSLPVEKERFASSPQPTLAFFTRNSTGWKLPAGDLACYRRGEYLGKALFQGLAPDETEEIVCGQ